MEHSAEFLELVDEARSGVREVSVAEARELVGNGAVLIDVREDNEYAAGHAAGAEHIGRGVIERDIRGKHPEKDEKLILYCGGGYRSALAAANLQKMGYSDVLSMAGGWSAWQEAGAPVEEEDR
jgi:rhodanese-related sulfurtransferase